MMKRITVKQLLDYIKEHRVPDDALVCLYSDAEGNEKSTTGGIYFDRVGRKESCKYNGEWFDYTFGEDIYGIDPEKEKGQLVLILQPNL